MMSLRGSSLRRVIVLYNTDYDAELIAAADESAVRASAQAVCAAIGDYGLECALLGVHGEDLGDAIAALRAGKPDLVFNLCESLSGDARGEMVVPAVLDMLGIPYTGSGALALGLCLHKQRSKDVLDARGIATPAHRTITGPDELCEAWTATLDYPYFLKLAREDASIGIDERNVVHDPGELAARARDLLAAHDQPVLAERYIAGREINVTLIGNHPGIDILPLHEIDFAAMPADRPHIVSYAAKWDESHVDFAGTRPVPIGAITEASRAAIIAAAMAAYRAFDVRDIGRVDLRLDAAGGPWVIDINPNCDLSPDAGVARAAACAGITYPQLIGRVCEIAWRRHEGSPARIV